MSIFYAIKKHAESLYNKTCNIYECETVRDIETGIDSIQEIEKYTNIPCRISYKSIPNTTQTDTGASLSQSISLFCSPDIDIKAGSRIVCNNKTYKCSGEPSFYVSHQRIELILEREWA